MVVGVAVSCFLRWPCWVGGEGGVAGCHHEVTPPDTQPRGRPTAPKAGTALRNPVSRPRAGLNAQQSGGGLKAKVASNLP